MRRWLDSEMKSNKIKLFFMIITNLVSAENLDLSQPWESNDSYIFLSQELGRNATFEEWVSTVESFDVGIGRMDMDPSHLDGVEVIPMSNGSKVD